MPPLRSTDAAVLLAPESGEDGFLPEGPRAVTLDGRPALLWVNIQTAPDATQGALHVRYWDTGGTESWSLPGRPGFALPTDRPGVLLVGLDHRVGTFDLDSYEWTPLGTVPDPHPRTIINDAEVTPDGRAVVFGTKDTRFAEPLAGLYLLTLGDNRVSRLAGGQTCSNGKVFAAGPDGLTLFDIDTPTKTVARYHLDVAARHLEAAGVALDLRTEPGFPDGMVDAGDGTVVVAYYNPEPVAAGRAVRYDLRTGEALEEWRAPASPRVTCPCLVQRADGVKLVLTTATEGMPAEQRALCPDAGSLFVADTRFARVPPDAIVKLG
ncbi:SMP-30/gluconolactonase/LRE family protein [bacterium]|nr:SMP-30/gluconolactonase/LRE family protein [bacterium]